MNKSELIQLIVENQSQLSSEDVALAVQSILEQMAKALSSGDRIEIRGFGSLSLQYRKPRIGRNPRTGESLALAGKHVPHFKTGKELRNRVNGGLEAAPDVEAIGAADSNVPGADIKSAQVLLGRREGRG